MNLIVNIINISIFIFFFVLIIFDIFCQIRKTEYKYIKFGYLFNFSLLAINIIIQNFQIESIQNDLDKDNDLIKKSELKIEEALKSKIDFSQLITNIESKKKQLEEIEGKISELKEITKTDFQAPIRTQIENLKNMMDELQTKITTDETTKNDLIKKMEEYNNKVKELYSYSEKIQIALENIPQTEIYPSLLTSNHIFTIGNFSFLISDPISNNFVFKILIDANFLIYEQTNENSSLILPMSKDTNSKEIILNGEKYRLYQNNQFIKISKQDPYGSIFVFLRTAKGVYTIIGKRSQALENITSVIDPNGNVFNFNPAAFKKGETFFSNQKNSYYESSNKKDFEFGSVFSNFAIIKQTDKSINSGITTAQNTINSLDFKIITDINEINIFGQSINF